MTSDRKIEQKTVMSAQCVNLLARFVRIARNEEALDIHLQDKDVIEKATQIAATTDRADLKAIHRRLMAAYNRDQDATMAKSKSSQPNQLQRVAKALGIHIN